MVTATHRQHSGAEVNNVTSGFKDAVQLDHPIFVFWSWHVFPVPVFAEIGVRFNDDAKLAQLLVHFVVFVFMLVL